MNNKGFTLVELLAVIVILLGISLVVLSSVTSSLEKRETNEKNNQEELAINAAKIYFSLNDTKYVQVKTLVENEYLDKTEIDKLDDTYYIKICTDKYVYSSGTSCS